LRSGKDLAYIGDVVLQVVLVQRVSDLQSVDERECRYLLTIVEDLGDLVLEEVDVGFEVVSRSHPDKEE